jgi:hypothetical protein
MPIPQLNLDNRSFDDLVEELRAIIPRYCREWTDHNPSDPGITLIELFAWVADTLIYRTNRIPLKSRWRLLELLIPEESLKMLRALGAADFDSVSDRDKAALLDNARIKAAENIKKPWRVVTAKDFEEVVVAGYSLHSPGRGRPVARVKCLADTDLSCTCKDKERIGHVSVIIVPEPKDEDDVRPVPDDGLVDEIQRFLDERRLITCMLHVVGPDYTEVAFSGKVICRTGLRTRDVRKAVIDNLRSFLSPTVGVSGGAVNNGWPFGRDVYESEICSLIEGTDGVDHVESLELLKKEGKDWIKIDKKIKVGPNSLVCFDRVESSNRISVTCRT